MAAATDASSSTYSVLMLAGTSARSPVTCWPKSRAGSIGWCAGPLFGPSPREGRQLAPPVALRVGGRTLGGALSWSTPQPLAPFDDTSLFAGLNVAPEVAINRQARRARQRRQDLGPAQRWNPAGDGTKTWRRPNRVVPRDRQFGLVEPAALSGCSSTCCAGSPPSVVLAALRRAAAQQLPTHPPPRSPPPKCWRRSKRSTATASCARRRRPPPPAAELDRIAPGRPGYYGRKPHRGRSTCSINAPR